MSRYHFLPISSFAITKKVEILMREILSETDSVIAKVKYNSIVILINVFMVFAQDFVRVVSSDLNSSDLNSISDSSVVL